MIKQVFAQFDTCMGSALPHDLFSKHDPERDKKLEAVSTCYPVYITNPDAFLSVLDISNSNIVKIDLIRMQRLRKLDARYCPRICITDGRFPASIEHIDVSNSGLKLASLDGLVLLVRFLADGCTDLQLAGKYVPRYLEEFALSESAVTTIDLRNCMKLRVLRLSQCKKIRLYQDFIPPTVQELQIDATMIYYADLRIMEKLEVFNIADNFNFVIRDNYIPKSVHALKCAGDSITKLELGEMKALEILDFSSNINVYYDILPASLKMLVLRETSVHTLDLRPLKSLQYLDVSGIIQLTLEQAFLPKSLITFLASECYEFALDKTNILALKSLNCLNISDTYFSATGVGIIPKSLKELIARGNSIKFIDLQGCELERLNICDNVGCEVSNIPPSIKYYNAGGHSATELALSLFPRLEELRLEGNKEIRLINSTMPATLKVLDIRSTSIRNIDFTQVLAMQRFLCDDELYAFKDGRLPLGLREYKTTRISDLNISYLKSLQCLDVSDNCAMAARYEGIFYKIPPTLRYLRICGASLRFLDLTEADSLERIAYKGNEAIQFRDGLIPQHLQSLTTSCMDFLDFSRTLDLKYLDLSENMGMMQYYAYLNYYRQMHYLMVPASVIEFLANGRTVQYLDLTAATHLQRISCCNEAKVWFKDGFVPAEVLELRSSQVYYVDLATASYLYILNISNNCHISVRNGYLPATLKQLLFAFDEEGDSLYALTLKLQHLKELYFVDCTGNPNVNFDGDFVPSNVEIVKVQGCKLIRMLNLIYAKTLKFVKVDYGVRLVDMPPSLEMLTVGSLTIEISEVLKKFLSYYQQTQTIHQMHNRIQNYKLKQQDLLARQQSQSPKRERRPTRQMSE